MGKKLVGAAAKSVSEKKAQQAIVDAYNYEKQAGELLLQADAAKEKAFVYMEQVGIKSMDVEQSNVKIRLQSTSRTSVTYDINALRKRFNKASNILKEIIGKKYTLTDIDELKSLMKRYKVPAKELQECLTITEFVDNKRLDELYDSGHITIKQLHGCYNIVESTTLKIKEL